MVQIQYFLDCRSYFLSVINIEGVNIGLPNELLCIRMLASQLKHEQSELQIRGMKATSINVYSVIS